MTDRVAVAFAWSALLNAGRTPALWAAMAVQIALYSSYLLVWGDGVPLVGARPVLDQFATVQWVFLGLALPWTAVRSGAVRRRDEVARLSLLGAVRPSAVVAGSLCATMAIAVAVTASGLPFAILAAAISTIPLAGLWGAQAPLFALGGCASAFASACMLVTGSRLLAWACATGLTFGVVALAPAGAAGGVVLAAVGAVAAAVVVGNADRRLLHLAEQA